MNYQAKLFFMDRVPKEMYGAVRKYQEKFQVCFNTLTYFPQSLLNELHQKATDSVELPSNLVIASLKEQSILEDVQILSRIANKPHLCTSDRELYLNTLKCIYKKLPYQPTELAVKQDTLCVGIEREGQILATALQCLPVGRSLKPHAKRIPYDGGILVGLSSISKINMYSRCLIIDGAIASGSTLISLINELRSVSSSFHIYSAHSTLEGLLAIYSYFKNSNLDIHIVVGDASGNLNKKYYAVDSKAVKQLVVGDLGDTIAPISS